MPLSYSCLRKSIFLNLSPIFYLRNLSSLFTPRWYIDVSMNFISTLALAMGSSWVSGINLYASVATLGLLGRFAHLHLPGELNAVTNWWVIGVSLFLYL